MSDRVDEGAVKAPSGLMPRAILSFLALPGVVAFVVPVGIVRLAHGTRPFARAGWLEILLGTVALCACARDFYVSGRGTLAPWAPPVHLVRGGLYRWSRNPMYIGVLLILTGWALGYGVPALWTYASLVAVAVHLRVILSEEPFLARTYGDEWTAYRKRVPRWLL